MPISSILPYRLKNKSTCEWMVKVSTAKVLIPDTNALLQSMPLSAWLAILQFWRLVTPYGGVNYETRPGLQNDVCINRISKFWGAHLCASMFYFWVGHSWLIAQLLHCLTFWSFLKQTWHLAPGTFLQFIWIHLSNHVAKASHDMFAAYHTSTTNLPKNTRAYLGMLPPTPNVWSWSPFLDVFPALDLYLIKLSKWFSAKRWDPHEIFICYLYPEMVNVRGSLYSNY